MACSASRHQITAAKWHQANWRKQRRKRGNGEKYARRGISAISIATTAARWLGVAAVARRKWRARCSGNWRQQAWRIGEQQNAALPAGGHNGGAAAASAAAAAA
jgi:hypothetical protein